MEGYLGEKKLVSLFGTPFDSFTEADWAMEYIGRYGGIDGNHHKAWVLDQVARILKGSPIEVSLAKWSNGHEEYHFTTGKPSKEYKKWVKEMLGEKDKETGEYEYDYDEGVAP
jgi:hypothetical protein